MSTPAIGEVVAAGTGEFTAELFREAQVPGLGSWVQVEQEDMSSVFGLVCQVEMGPYDQNRCPVALRRTAAELQQEMPHVLELLRTTFRVIVCAHRSRQGDLRQSLPLRPVQIHQFAFACDDEWVRRLGEPYDYLRILVSRQDIPIDEVLVAVLRGIAASHGGYDEVVRAGRALSRLLRDDHERLQSILRRAE
ncbi:MAG: hypothetical protein OXI38_05695 [Bacteroidota bacterium]|nr:hypothetical protein [Bacteroidota bacterium]